MQIVLENVSKRYGERTVLRDFSAVLADGGVCVVTGASGAGKTTLLHLLMGLVEKDAGSITENVHYSVVFQDNRLLPNRTAVENLQFVAKKGVTVQEIRDYLQEILPPESLTQPIEELSGGMQRRVAIARAMLAKSDCVVLDEPFTGLDEGTSDAVLAFIMRHQNNRTLIFSTHQPKLLAQLQTQHLELDLLQ